METEAVVQSKERRTETREETRSDGNGGQRVVGTYQVQVCALNLIFDADRSTDGVRCRVTAEKIRCSLEFYQRLTRNPGQKVTVKYMPDEPRFFTTKGVGERDPRDGNAAILGILLSSARRSRAAGGPPKRPDGTRTRNDSSSVRISRGGRAF